jgi:tetratricopeptide (TPR) repeat protein
MRSADRVRAVEEGQVVRLAVFLALHIVCRIPADWRHVMVFPFGFHKTGPCEVDPMRMLKPSLSFVVVCSLAVTATAQQVDDKIVADYTEAIRLDPKDPSAYVGRGYAWIAKTEYDKALSDFNEAIRLDPKVAEFYAGRGNAWIGKREYDKALADFNAVSRLNPKDPSAYYNRGLARFAKGEYDKAISDCNEAIRIDPQYAVAYAFRGGVWLFKGDKEKALADFNEAIRLNPKDGSAYINRGGLWEAKREYDKALADFDEAIIWLNSKSPNAYVSRGDVWRAKGDNGKALADYNEAIRLAPKTASPWNARAWLAATCAEAKYRNGKKAVEDATRACDLTGTKTWDYLYILAAAYAEAGAFDAAVKWEEKSIELAPENDKANLRSRLALYKAHKPYYDERKN